MSTPLEGSDGTSPPPGAGLAPLPGQPQGEMSQTEMMRMMAATMAAQAQAIQVLQNNPGAPSAQAAHVSAPAPQVAFPPCVSRPTAPRKSLLSAFPLVEASMLLDITRHEFRPSDLRKLDLGLRERADTAGSSVLSSFDKTELSIKDYPDIHSLLNPLCVFFSILSYYAASSSNLDVTWDISMGMTAYTIQLLELSRRYRWEAVVAYHLAFHGHRRREMMEGNYSGWQHTDRDLHAQYLSGREATVKSNVSSSASASTSKPRSEQVCFDHNQGKCTKGTEFSRKHVCGQCASKDHVKKDCTKKKA